MDDRRRASLLLLTGSLAMNLSLPTCFSRLESGQGNGDPYQQEGWAVAYDHDCRSNRSD
jgi:hypothetical protein